MSLQDYTSLASVALSGGMLLVWLVYAWLFFQEFQRRRSAVIFIHEVGGGRQESRCLLVNLSEEPVHVLCSLTEQLHTKRQSREVRRWLDDCRDP